jgi:hypothetical protein
MNEYDSVGMAARYLLLLLLAERAFALVPGNWSATGAQYGDSTILVIGGVPSIALPNGDVFTYVPVNPIFEPLYSLVEVYSPVTGGWSVIEGDYNISVGAQCCLLFIGKVLCTGGYEQTYGSTASSTAWVYDPTTWTVSRVADMSVGRQSHALVAIPTGAIAFAGIFDSNSYLNSFEVYDAAADTWELETYYYGSINVMSAVGIYLNFSDAVLFCGGYAPSGRGSDSPVDTAYLFFEGTIQTTAGSMTSPRFEHSVILLSNGTALIAGGYGASGLVSTTETYSFESNSFTAAASMNVARGQFGFAQLKPGYFVAAGGYGPSTIIDSVEVYYAPNQTWTVVSPMITPRGAFQLTPLPGGLLLAAGGTSETLYQPVYLAEVYSQLSHYTAPASAPVFLLEPGPTTEPTEGEYPTLPVTNPPPVLSTTDSIIIGAVLGAVVLLLAGTIVLLRVKRSTWVVFNDAI